ncbi:hypothetical protein RJ55_02811 [Drechmeria coniospora]|nr:hypothetical protein RJ55_02811 [Drechmeria coniospora]
MHVVPTSKYTSFLAPSAIFGTQQLSDISLTCWARAEAWGGGEAGQGAMELTASPCLLRDGMLPRGAAVDYAHGGGESTAPPKRAALLAP